MNDCDPFACPYLQAEVELSDERERHIAGRHPDLLPDHRACLAETLIDPDQIRRSKRFGSARLFSKWYAQIRGGKPVVMVVVSGSDGSYHGLYNAEPWRGRDRVGAKLTFKYDREADVSHIDKRPPYAEQESQELGDEVIARLNPQTGAVENLEVLFFSTRLLRGDLFEVAIEAELHIARSRTAHSRLGSR